MASQSTLTSVRAWSYALEFFGRRLAPLLPEPQRRAVEKFRSLLSDAGRKNG